ncbi:MAG: VCBS repeat-containing protein, partial [Verrucomicrobiales bacterium]|nr:VCBS repeat-containing protein [Verrucomicrobiales bacterium]
MSRGAHAFFWQGLALAGVAWFALIPASARADLAWQAGAGFRSAALPVPKSGQAGFTLLRPNETGITFSNRLSDRAIAHNRLLEVGSGVALGDIDGDGWVDVYFCGLEGDNVLYRNLGNWKFEDITSGAGVACPNQFSTGCALADLDGDSDLDLLVNSLGGGTRLFLNDGTGHFTEMIDSGLIRRFGATSLALADVNGDGDLDLYVTNYRSDTFHDHPPGFRMTTRRQPNGSLAVEPQDRFVTLTTRDGGPGAVEKGEPDFLYLNRAQRFVPLPWEGGIFLNEDGVALSAPPTDWGLSVIFRDLNGDGLPDLYVCNDYVHWPDRIWLNQAGKRFQAMPRTAIRSGSLASMPVDVADINRDGFDDIFVADMLSPRREFRAWQRPDTLEGMVKWPIHDPNFRPEVTRNTLQLARGDGTFAEIARLAGVSATDWTWGVAFLDVDLDGWEDLIISTGANHDLQDADVMGSIARTDGWKTAEARLKNQAKIPRLETPGIALRNRRDLTFEEVSAAWGFNVVGIAQGLALADLDNDGDLDVVINCLNAPARIHRNESSAPRIAVRLKGAGANSRGIGAKIEVSGGPVTQTQEMIAGGRYLSGDDAMRVFAAGSAQQLELAITWRSGKRSVLTDCRPNYVYEVDEGAAGEVQSSKFKVQTDQKLEIPAHALTSVATLFEDVSARLKHVHVDVLFDDFARQPLLPRKLSTLGPGLSWADYDGDGFDDLLIGGGNGGRPIVFHNDGKGNLTEWSEAPVPKANPRDQTSLLVWQPASGGARLLAGESNWEDAETNAPPFRVFALQAGAQTNLLPALRSGRSATGPLALADLDGDGDLDLFVGGRVMAGRYPEPVTSYLLRNEAGAFSVMQTFPALGLVSGAVFFDCDGDGDSDLALACEWDSIRLLRNDKGTFVEGTEQFGLARFSGWWNGIAVGDFDGDGRLDLVASNWGRNWRTDQPASVTIPVQMFYGDFAGDGVVQTLLASADPWLSKVTPWRERKVVAAAIPSVAERLPDHHAYGRASVQEVLGDKAAMARELLAATPDSTVFLNRGDHFEARPLPIEAQFAPAFGVSVADFDGDGNEDLFLAQNFFGVDAETSRHDAGIGLALLGDGRGGFRALGPRESGVVIYGEQRGSAVADFDGDGRMDLAVAQHGGPAKLFRNVRGAAG